MAVACGLGTGADGAEAGSARRRGGGAGDLRRREAAKRGCVLARYPDNPAVMAFDPSQIQLPPRGAKLRLPPKNGDRPTYTEVCQIVRRHLGDEVTSLQPWKQIHIQPALRHVESAGVR